jgi:predicted Zn-dependent protease
VKYENPKIPEGINVSTEHPLIDFLMLAVGVALSVCAIVVLLAWSAEYAARFVPFSVERSLVEKAFLTDRYAAKDEAQVRDIDIYLKALTQRLVNAANLPEGMTVRSHLIEDETINAYATLGGNIFILRGLFERMPNENALAMVIAHEIAHIKHRDPIIAMARGISVSFITSTLIGMTNNSLAGGIVGQAGLFTALRFSREQETAADAAALNVLAEVYGHLGGATDLFEILGAESTSRVPEFFSSHPRSERRISGVSGRTAISENGPLIPLPTFPQANKATPYYPVPGK